MRKVSIVADLHQRECYICHYGGDLELHHMIHGSNRALADEDRLTCWLCNRCHRALHDRGYHDRLLQQEAQFAWMRHNHKGVDEWIARYGKSYI